MTLVACQDVSSPGGKPLEATVLAAVSPTQLEGIAGTWVEDLPAVMTQDSDGDPVAGVIVTFSVIEGSGRVTGNTVTSNSAGVARLGGWQLGGGAGQNAVAARSGLLSQATFRANGLAGPPAAIAKQAGDQQVAAPGTVTDIAPQVRLTDAHANPVAGVAVTFVVLTGGGSLTSASTTTDSSGLASAGSWRLGTRGTQTLVARAGALETQSFTALALAFAPCATDNVLPENTVVASTLTDQSCPSADGTFQERIRIDVPYAGAFQFDLGSGDFDTNLELIGTDLIAGNDDFGQSTNSSVKVLLPAGSYTLIAGASKAGALGKYSVSYRRVSESVDGCEHAFVARGAVADQTTGPNDCDVGQGEQAERFHIFLRSGSTVTIEVHDISYSNHKLTLSKFSGELLQAATTSAYVDTIVFTSPADAYYRIDVSNAGENGAQYSLKVK